MRLAFYRVANVFDGFADLPAGLANALFDLPTGVFSATLSLEFLVVYCTADSFFSFSFGLI
jgi:hypothetical protein